VSLYALDTDILSLYQRGHAIVCQNVAAHGPTDLAITVISVKEQLSGWYALLRGAACRDHLSLAYQSLADSIPFLAKFRILAFPETAIEQFERLAALKLNIRRMDLRIAAIALEHGAVMVTRNVRDFQRVPDLAVEDWTEFMG
jgi:tRNA(fMet)-specific endonuclease VapC